MKNRIYNTLIYAAANILMLLWYSPEMHAENNPEAYTVEGIVIDQESKKPMEYATVRLFALPDSSLIDGMVTDQSGQFKLKAPKSGKYVLHISFLGFDPFIQEVSLNGEKHIKLGEVKLHPASEAIEEVTVTANRHSVEYKIDRKVIHVAEQYASLSGNATDVLESVPSIQVDIEGNVTLRGNSNFTVLIDDRPTVLEPNDALQQIPAAMIQDIEIITNPSAKYDPEGTAGIINIITKKRSLNGLSGIVSANVGPDDKYGGDLLLNYRTDKFNFMIGGDFNHRDYPGYNKEERHTTINDTTHFLLSEGDRLWGHQHFSGRFGIEWFPNKNNTIGINVRSGGREMRGESVTDFEEWYSYSDERTFYDSESIFTRSGNFSSLSANYTGIFSDKRHKLDAQFMYYMRDGEERSENNLFDTADLINDGQISTEKGPAGGYSYRLNYMQPFSESFNIEAGAQGRFRSGTEINEIFNYEPETQEYILQPLYSHDVEYNRNIHAVYGLTKGELNRFGYQVGLRGEYTYRNIRLTDIDDTYNIDRFDYFPTLHFSYKTVTEHQFMASYSRRIQRPRGWFLEPFLTWTDAYNVRSGNPDLLPEYIDAYEVSYQKEFGKNAFTAEMYYRVTENNIERIQSIYNETVTLHSFENVGNDYSLGTEVTLNLSPVKWWDANISGNFYDYRVKGELNGQSFDKHSFTWSVRWDNILKLGKETRLQINPYYRAPEEEAQEREEGYFMLNMALRQNLFDNKINLTLQARDVFGTRKREDIIDEPDFYSYELRYHKSPIVMLNITWRINNYKSKRNGNNMGGDGEEMQGEEM